MATKERLKRGTHAVGYFRRKYVEGRPDREIMLAEEEGNAEIAGAIYDMRTYAGMSQQDVADAIGTQKSAISRLEDADYDGHSLGMLRRIATTLGYTITIVFKQNRTASARVSAGARKQPVAGKSYTGTDRKLAVATETKTLAGSASPRRATRRRASSGARKPS